MATSIFTSQTPAILDGDDGTDYTLGTEFSRSTDGTITHGRLYFGSTVAPATAMFVLYDVASETELARETFVDKSPGWQTVELSSPVPYTADTPLVASYYTSAEYVATANFFSSDLVNDDITAPGATNGRLGNTDQYPSIVSGNNACFFADVVFAADNELVHGAGLAALGALAGTAAGHRTVHGSAATSLGALAGSAAGHRLVHGAAATALGALAATGAGGRTIHGSGSTSAALSATASGRRAVHGAGSASLGPLVATGLGPHGGALVVRPNTGLVVRPFTGLVVRP